MISLARISRGTQREYSSKPLKHSIVKRILNATQMDFSFMVVYICLTYRMKKSSLHVS